MRQELTMGIKQYDTQGEMDDDFEHCMERMQKEKRLKDAICDAEERVASARDALNEAEEELQELQDQLDELAV
jgi:chromosome segregation ATPase